MKLNAIMIGALLAGCLMALSTPAVEKKAASKKTTPPQAVANPATPDNTFAINMYKEMSQVSGDIFLSPLSIETALSMVYTGARGETARQMAEVLGPAISIKTSTKPYISANSIWVQDGYPFSQKFLSTQKSYGAELRNADFSTDRHREEARTAINDWVADKTGNLIRDLIAPASLNSLTRMVLANAIYYKGKWELPFNVKETVSIPFKSSSRQIPAMHQTASFNYSENESVQALELPYKGREMSMVVILPRDEVDLGVIEAKLSKEMLTDLTKSMNVRKVEVFLPKFRSEQDVTLVKVLQRMGMVDAFDPAKADLSGISKSGLYISDVVHKAIVEVNEEGTEAAAATGVVVGTKSLSSRPIIFKADRPFIYIIRDNTTGEIVFIGRLTNPS